MIDWDDESYRAFETLKCTLTNKPILRHPDFQKQFILRTDASDGGLGAVIVQEHDGINMPVMYISRKLSDTKTRYSTIERECLGLFWATKRLHVYVYGTEFVLETDHQPLAFMNRSKISNDRVMRGLCKCKCAVIKSVLSRVQIIQQQISFSYYCILFLLSLLYFTFYSCIIIFIILLLLIIIIIYHLSFLLLYSAWFLFPLFISRFPITPAICLCFTTSLSRVACLIYRLEIIILSLRFESIGAIQAYAATL